MVSLHLVDSTDVDLIAALRGENLPEPGAGRYFSADHYGAVIGYGGLEGDRRDLLLRSLVVLADQKARAWKSGAGRRRDHRRRPGRCTSAPAHHDGRALLHRARLCRRRS